MLCIITFALKWICTLSRDVTQFSFLLMKVNSYRKNAYWPGLGLPRPKAIVVIPKNQPLPKCLRKKTSKSAKYHRPLRYEKRPVKITMYLGLDIIIKLMFTTNFDRCAMLNVLNYLTTNLES